MPELLFKDEVYAIVGAASLEWKRIVLTNGPGQKLKQSIYNPEKIRVNSRNSRIN